MEQKFRDIPDFYKVKTNKLTDYLGSPSLWAKRAAWHQIADRPMKKTRRLASDLISLAMDTTQNTVTRIHALWSLEEIGQASCRERGGPSVKISGVAVALK